MKLGLGFKGERGSDLRQGERERESRRPRAATMANTASGPSRLHLAWLRLLLFGWLFAVLSQTSCARSGLQPLSDADRETAAGYFTADADGFYGSLQETYHALRALQILERPDVESQKICDSLVGVVQAPLDSVEDSFYVVKIADILQCPQGAEVAEVIVPSLQAAVEKAKSLLELHYSVGTIATIKKQGWSSRGASFNDALSDVFSSLKELAGPNGTWHYTTSSSESSAKAAGIAFGIAAAVVEVIGSAHDDVAVTTVLGKPVSQVKVTLVSAHRTGADAPPVWSSQNLNYVEDSGKYVFEFLSATPDLGKYKLKLEDSAGKVRGAFKLYLRVDFVKDEKISLSANHLQKLRLSFKPTSPSGSPFNPQQVFLKLVHESQVEHLYLVKSSGKGFQLTLDFLGLVEKLHYLSGTYNIVLIVGDMMMVHPLCLPCFFCAFLLRSFDIALTLENSFVWTLATLNLDLPKTPKGTPPLPKIPLEMTHRFGPKPEIAHMFRQPEKRPPTLLSNIFLSLTVLPLIGFVTGLGYLGANMKLFPTTGLPGAAAVGFHGAVASILVLYFLFWLNLDLFTTLKVLGFLGLCTLPPGHFISFLPG